MNEVQIFNNPEFGDIRTVMVDGNPWFVGVDVARALGYKKPTGAITTNVDEGDSLREGISDANGHRQIAIVINESGMYSLIFGSKLESAKKFKRWVTGEVLPTIRKTGTYGQPQLPKTPMELLELHYQAIKQVDSRVDEVKAELERFKQEVPLFGEECTEINKAVSEKVHDCLGGKSSGACRDKSLHRRLFRDIYSQANRELGVRTYKSISRSQKNLYLELVENYVPPLHLQADIDGANAQQALNL